MNPFDGVPDEILGVVMLQSDGPSALMLGLTCVRAGRVLAATKGAWRNRLRLAPAPPLQVPISNQNE